MRSVDQKIRRSRSRYGRQSSQSDGTDTLNELADAVLMQLEDFELGPGMPAIMPDQQNYQRKFNQPNAPQMTGSRGDLMAIRGESPNNMTGSTPLTADSDEQSREKSPLRANIAHVIDIRNKITPGDIEIRTHGVTHNESFTGTAGIAMPPGPYDVLPEEEADDQEKPHAESTMTQLDQLLREYEADFKAGGYNPGDYQMPSPTGHGVAARELTHNNVGKRDTELSDAGQPWPRTRKRNVATGVVDDDGVDHRPQGEHESKHAEANDGIQKEVGHNWPDEAHNTGSGVAEPFEGTRWSDGGVLKGQAPHDEMYRSGGPGMPGEGPITGTSGPQLGQPWREGWNINDIGDMIEEDTVGLQALFDSYARRTEAVCLEDFSALCRAHGLTVDLDEVSLQNLMHENREYIFYEGYDANGVYWTPTPTAHAQLVSETHDPLSPHVPVPPGERMGPHMEPDGEFDPGAGHSEYDQAGPGAMGAPDAGPVGAPDMGLEQHECPGCGAPSVEGHCSECGTEIGPEAGPGPGHEGSLGPSMEPPPMHGPPPGHGAGGPGAGGPGHVGHGHAPRHHQYDYAESELVDGPVIAESLRGFMASVRNILNRREQFEVSEIAEALTYSWRHYANDINPATCPQKAKQVLRALSESYPGFSPLRFSMPGSATDNRAIDGSLSENLELGQNVGPRHAMEKAEGTPIGGSANAGNKSHWLSEGQPGPSDMEQIGSKENPLDRHQKNDYKETPVIPGTEKKSTQAVQENVARLAAHVRRQLAESAKGLKSGNYRLVFAVTVEEGSKRTKTAEREQLAEALLDAEEILQLFNPSQVSLEASFCDSTGGVVLKQDIPLVTINARGPIVSEGKTLFRFKRHADDFAQRLVSEGQACRVTAHNWGRAVASRAPYRTALKCFRSLAG